MQRFSSPLTAVQVCRCLGHDTECGHISGAFRDKTASLFVQLLRVYRRDRELMAIEIRHRFSFDHDPVAEWLPAQRAVAHGRADV